MDPGNPSQDGKTVMAFKIFELVLCKSKRETVCMVSRNRTLNNPTGHPSNTIFGLVCETPVRSLSPLPPRPPPTSPPTTPSPLLSCHTELACTTVLCSCHRVMECGSPFFEHTSDLATHVCCCPFGDGVGPGLCDALLQPLRVDERSMGNPGQKNSREEFHNSTAFKPPCS